MHNIGKKIAYTFMSVFLIWQSYELLRVLDELEVDTYLGLAVLAWVINMFITGIFAFAGFTWPTNRLLPDAYYHIHRPTRLQSVYDQLGVKWFRKALLSTLWRSQQQRQKHFNGKVSGLQHLELQSRKAEFGHLLPFVFLLGVSLYLGFLGAWMLAVFTFLINLLGNLYPVLLQRHHRMRLQRLWERFA